MQRVVGSNTLAVSVAMMDLGDGQTPFLPHEGPICSAEIPFVLPEIPSSLSEIPLLAFLRSAFLPLKSQFRTSSKSLHWPHPTDIKSPRT